MEDDYIVKLVLGWDPVSISMIMIKSTFQQCFLISIAAYTMDGNVPCQHVEAFTSGTMCYACCNEQSELLI